MRTRLLLSLLGLLFGGSILFISLFSATQVSSTGGQAASESKLYFSQEILPDHSLYKVLMAVDRIQLETAPTQEQVYMRLEYSDRRLEYAKALLEKDNKPLAGVTLLKSQNYLHQAVQGALAENTTSTLQERVLTALEYHSKQLTEIGPKLEEPARGQVDRILKEHEILHASLTAKLSKN